MAINTSARCRKRTKQEEEDEEELEVFVSREVPKR
jgi:hypothetical protein